jgi:hypothetical protein
MFYNMSNLCPVRSQNTHIEITLTLSFYTRPRFCWGWRIELYHCSRNTEARRFCNDLYETGQCLDGRDLLLIELGARETGTAIASAKEVCAAA